MRNIFFVLVVIYADFAFAENAATPPVITVSDAGVGPINAKTPFNQKAIQKLLPTLNVTKSVGSSEGEEFPVLEVSDKNGLLFTINSSEKKIFSVVFEKDRVTNELGHKIGERYEKVYKNGSGKCTAGLGEYSGSVFCSAPGSKHINYVFDGQWNGSESEVPPLKILNGWTISAIFWKP
ncbi:MAG TPA: DUF1131 family protein [Burkholderiaceae bacterium]|jgi:hypothetical protein